MIDETPEQKPEPHEPGQQPSATGDETSFGGASEWSTVPTPSVGPLTPVQPPVTEASPSAPVEPVSSLEPLPQSTVAPPLETGGAPVPPTGPPVTPPEYNPHAPEGYEPVYGTTGQQPPPPPPPPGYASGGGYPPPTQPPYGGPGQPGYPPPGTPGQGLSSTAAAALSYITFIPAVIFLVMEPYNRDRFVRFHAWQCIALTVVWIGIGIIFRVLGFAGLHLLWWVIHSFITLALFVFWLIALVKASQGQWYRIPIVGDLAGSFSGKEQ